MDSEELGQVNMHDAKTHLSRLVERVEGGAEIVISRAGKPAAKLVPVEAPNSTRRKLGVWEGMGIELPSDEEMAQMDKEIAEEFYGPEDEWPEDWKTR
jgi:prevent-host-death family protein